MFVKGSSKPGLHRDLSAVERTALCEHQYIKSSRSPSNVSNVTMLRVVGAQLKSNHLAVPKLYTYPLCHSVECLSDSSM